MHNQRLQDLIFLFLGSVVLVSASSQAGEMVTSSSELTLI